jgi:uncharacterized protein
MKRILIISLIVVALTVSVFALNLWGKQEVNLPVLQIIKIGGKILNVEVANTPEKQTQGLSGKEGLTENQGMLFVFNKEGYYGFWMKDMKFSIDIAWLNKDKKIIHIEENVLPETYPKVFYAFRFDNPILNLYVLETKANFFKNSGIKIGDVAEF